MESVEVRSVLIKRCSGRKPAVADLVPAQAVTSPARAVVAENTKNAAIDSGFIRIREKIDQIFFNSKKSSVVSKLSNI